MPARRSLHVKNSRRQRSLPPPANAANPVNSQPASTEVISSLISSLSAISSPAADHFNALPNLALTSSTPSSPNPYQPEHPGVFRSRGDGCRSNPASPVQAGFGVCYGAYDSPTKPLVNDLSHPYDAAIAPVVRASKHPSALLTLTAPKRHSLRRSLRSGSGVSQVTITRTFEEIGSMATLAMDPRPRHCSASIESLESREMGSLRRSRSLVVPASQERRGEACQIRDWQANQAAGNSNLGARSIDSRLGGASVSLPASPLLDNTNTDIDAFWDSSQAPARAASSKKESQLLWYNAALDVNTTPRGVGGGMVIPMRDSSTRHRHMKSPTKPKRRSYLPEDKMSPNRTESKGEANLASNAGLEEVTKVPKEQVDEVTKRIKELQDLKKKRDCSPVIDTMEPRQTIDSPLSEAKLGPTLIFRSPSRHPGSIRKSRAAQAEDLKAPDPVRDEVTVSTTSTIQRHERDSVSSAISTTLRTGTRQLSESSTAITQVQLPPPKRSNSRLRRIVRPIGASGADENKRTFSKRLSQPMRVSEVEERPASADSIDDAVEEYLSSPRLSQRIHHPQTGRVISFSEVGDPTGSVVFCCVGMGLTRYITAFYDELASTLKLRLITPDRPGVGESEEYADGSDTPLSWPDDVLAICQQLKINRFSILAHSAGAIYALATALRMPQHIRGRIHLLAPWIPPSQLSVIGTHQESLPVNSLPYSQRFLRSLPTPFLKAANSNFLSVKSASITTSLPRSPRKSKRRSIDHGTPGTRGADVDSPTPVDGSRCNPSMARTLQINIGADSPLAKAATNPKDPNTDVAAKTVALTREQEKERQSTYDIRLTNAIWGLATKKANPAVDLLVCLERRQTIGFRYVDITRSVVIHHGSKDSRVPVENVRWLGKLMRRCDVRVLDGEGHGLMASAVVMGNVLLEIAREWEDWQRVVQGKKATEKRALTSQT